MLTHSVSRAATTASHVGPNNKPDAIGEGEGDDCLLPALLLELLLPLMGWLLLPLLMTPETPAKRGAACPT